MAEGYFNHKSSMNNLQLKSVSAGISAYDGESAAPMAVKVMERLYGVDISAHRSQSVVERDVNEALLILTMSRMHKHIMISNFPEHREKIFTLSEYALEPDSLQLAEDIKDPIMTNEKTYGDVAQQIASYVDKVIECLI